jgi:hypothetical protein
MFCYYTRVYQRMAFFWVARSAQNLEHSYKKGLIKTPKIGYTKLQ